MTAKADVTAEYLREYFIYDKGTGLFINRKKRWLALAGQVVGQINAVGYLVVGIHDRSWLLHRLAFLYVTGEWPKNHVDHIDGNKLNNRWGNLRDVSQELNTQNVKTHRKHNKLGVLGVQKTPSGSFMARVVVKGKSFTKNFATLEEAQEHYLALKRFLHEGNTL